MSMKKDEGQLFERFKEEELSRYFSDVGYHRSEKFLSSLMDQEAPYTPHTLEEVLMHLDQQDRPFLPRKNLSEASSHTFFQPKKPPSEPVREPPRDSRFVKK